MKVPVVPITLMHKAYLKIFPAVLKELSYWKFRANNIPDPELRKQALSSIEHKKFHCEGGALMALMACENYKLAIKFIVAYQTISDYLDNLCDRSTSLDPDDFAALHEAMKDSLSNKNIKGDYYRYRFEKDDGGYLQDLVSTCQETLNSCIHYDEIKNFLFELCDYYCALQVHKHVKPSERIPRLQEWFNHHKSRVPQMEWYEFSACCGSTLGIFSLISYSLNRKFDAINAEKLFKGYFPFIQGLHILLDYFIDQDEDKREGDLNFCTYYENEDQLFSRLHHFIKKADHHTKGLPYYRFHQLINRGLLGLYLSDRKVRKQTNVKKLARGLIKTGGIHSIFFYFNAVVYRLSQEFGQIGGLKKQKSKQFDEPKSSRL